MKKIAIIADDLTGANDAGSQVFLQGYTCCSLNSTSRKPAVSIEVPVYNSSTRQLSGKKAYNKVKILSSSLLGYDLIYKKTDSTLRGNIGYEIDGCIDALKTDKAAFVTAFPGLKRCSVYGRLFLGAKVIENTEFASDVLNPVLSSDIIELLKKQSKYKAVLIELDIIRRGPKAVLEFIAEQDRRKNNKVIIYIFDCISLTDLETISKSLKCFKVIAGAASLIKYILKKKKRKISGIRYQTAENQAVFIGSTKTITHSQLGMLRKQTRKKDVIFAVKHGSKGRIFSEKEGKRIDKAFAEAAIGLIKEGRYGKLVLSGGATAENIFKALKINYTLTIGRILTGVPLTYSPERNLYIVTKPGGYGNKNALVTIYKKLKEL
ncbi:MAG: four-carbon acid sugar kinase family protein [Candidatus Firestonebacteria bacterium]